MKPSSLYAKLWDCVTRDEVLTVLKTVPHATNPIANRRNNKAPIKANRDSIAAVMEGVTNGHDAVIRLWAEQKKFHKTPRSVNDALAQIAASSMLKTRPKPLVHVLLQLRKGSKFHKAHAVTIVDEGIGMTAEAMLAGVLTFGSEDKVLDSTQFGSFGQGSASLFGHSQCSIIASRRAGTNRIVFTAVWLNKPPNAIHSYVYLTKPDGSLFEFAASDLPQAASLSEGIHTTLETNIPILPHQGTIRRQLEIDGVPEYYSQRGNCIYYALMDRMFGCPGYVRMAADDDKGHLNNRRGRRHEFNSVDVGDLLPRSNWRMMGHIPPANITVHRRAEVVGLCQVETWVIASYLSESNEVFTPARRMLEGSDRATPRNIFVTLNGQTLARLHSTPLFNRARLREIAENLIIEVSLDYLPEHILQDAEVFLASRDGVVDWFEKALLEEIHRYLEGHEELRLLAKEMIPPEDPVEMSENFSVDINKVLNDPIFGAVIGYRSTAKTKTKLAGQIVERRKEEITLVDPPTRLELSRDTVVRNATNWLTLRTNAMDHYGPRIGLVLPSFLTQIGPARLRNGHMTVAVNCDGTPLGTNDVIIARLKGTKLEAVREITIISKVESKKPSIVGDAYTTKGPPQTKLLEIHGPGDRQWPAYFASATQPTEAALNYNLSENVLEVALHTAFPPLLDTKLHLENHYGPLVARDFYRRVCQQFQINAMVFCRNEILGEYGASDAQHLSVLTDIARGIIVWAAALYRSTSFRNNVIGGVKDEW